MRVCDVFTCVCVCVCGSSGGRPRNGPLARNRSVAISPTNSQPGAFCPASIAPRPRAPHSAPKKTYSASHGPQVMALKSWSLSDYSHGPQVTTALGEPVFAIGTPCMRVCVCMCVCGIISTCSTRGGGQRRDFKRQRRGTHTHTRTRVHFR